MPCEGRALREPPSDWRAQAFPSVGKFREAGTWGRSVKPSISRLGGPGRGGACEWSLGPAAEMDEDGLPLMGSGIDLTKVCKRRSWTSGDLGGGRGRDARWPGRPHLSLPRTVPDPWLAPAGLGRESRTVPLEKGPVLSCWGIVCLPQPSLPKSRVSVAGCSLYPRLFYCPPYSRVPSLPAGSYCESEPVLKLVRLLSPSDSPPPRFRENKWMCIKGRTSHSSQSTPLLLIKGLHGVCSSCTNHTVFYITQVPAIQQKRTVAFLNQFVVHTVQFLNRFSTVCEEVGSVILVSWGAS